MVTSKSYKLRKATIATRKADFWYTIAYKAIQLYRYAVIHWKKNASERDELLKGIEVMHEPEPDSPINDE